MLIPFRFWFLRFRNRRNTDNQQKRSSWLPVDGTNRISMPVARVALRCTSVCHRSLCSNCRLGVAFEVFVEFHCSQEELLSLRFQRDESNTQSLSLSMLSMIIAAEVVCSVVVVDISRCGRRCFALRMCFCRRCRSAFASSLLSRSAQTEHDALVYIRLTRRHRAVSSCRVLVDWMMSIRCSMHWF